MHGITPFTASRHGRRQSDQLRHAAGYLDECFCSMRAPLCSMECSTVVTWNVHRLDAELHLMVEWA